MFIVMFSALTFLFMYFMYFISLLFITGYLRQFLSSFQDVVISEDVYVAFCGDLNYLNTSENCFVWYHFILALHTTAYCLVEKLFIYMHSSHFFKCEYKTPGRLRPPLLIYSLLMMMAMAAIILTQYITFGREPKQH